MSWVLRKAISCFWKEQAPALFYRSHPHAPSVEMPCKLKRDATKFTIIRIQYSRDYWNCFLWPVGTSYSVNLFMGVWAELGKPEFLAHPHLPLSRWYGTNIIFTGFFVHCKVGITQNLTHCLRPNLKISTSVDSQQPSTGTGRASDSQCHKHGFNPDLSLYIGLGCSLSNHLCFYQ